MIPDTRLRGYRIRWEHGEMPQHVCASIDHGSRRVTLRYPDSSPVTVDVVAARATAMILSDAVYRALGPEGPFLAMQADLGNGWIDLRDLP